MIDYNCQLDISLLIQISIGFSLSIVSFIGTCVLQSQITKLKKRLDK